MVENPLASIVIVLYNSGDFIEPCLESLARSAYRRQEIILVDNCSEDGSPEKARRCADTLGLRPVISRLERNRGFAAASNHGFSLSRGEVVVFLNPDTEVYPDMVGTLVEAAGEEGVGIAGCRVYYPDRHTLQHAGGYIRDNGLSMHYGFNEEDRGQFEDPADVPYVTGAAMAMRRSVFIEAGMLDEGYYPAYFEETDLCLKVRRLGYRVVYAPGAKVVHHESTTTGRFTERYYYLYHRSRVRYILKNYSGRFLLDRALPMEQRWIGMIEPEEQAIPLNKAYLVNMAKLPGILFARRRMERVLRAPRIEDTVSEL